MKTLPIRSYLVGAMVLAVSSSAALALEINSASSVDLVQAGFSKTQAERIVAYHKTHGDFQSSSDWLKVKGVTKATLQKVSTKLNSGASAVVGADTEAEAAGQATAGKASAAGAGSAAAVQRPVETSGGSSAGAGAAAGASLGVGAGSSGGAAGVKTQGSVGIGIGQ